MNVSLRSNGKLSYLAIYFDYQISQTSYNKFANQVTPLIMSEVNQPAGRTHTDMAKKMHKQQPQTKIAPHHHHNNNNPMKLLLCS